MKTLLIAMITTILPPNPMVGTCIDIDYYKGQRAIYSEDRDVTWDLSSPADNGRDLHVHYNGQKWIISEGRCPEAGAGIAEGGKAEERNE